MRNNLLETYQNWISISSFVALSLKPASLKTASLTAASLKDPSCFVYAHEYVYCPCLHFLPFIQFLSLLKPLWKHHGFQKILPMLTGPPNQDVMMIGMTAPNVEDPITHAAKTKTVWMVKSANKDNIRTRAHRRNKMDPSMMQRSMMQSLVMQASMTKPRMMIWKFNSDMFPKDYFSLCEL
jgi:hypothetical protein